MVWDGFYSNAQNIMGSLSFFQPLVEALVLAMPGPQSALDTESLPSTGVFCLLVSILNWDD